MADIKVVFDKLQSFETADDLAEFFCGYGIMAQPRNSRNCPISRFVREETGYQSVATNTTSVRIYEDETERSISERLVHTNAMADFVDRYDRGFYPTLVEEGYDIETLNFKCCESCG